MDIAALSTVMSQTKIKQSAGIAVMKQAMDAQKAQSDALIKMMKELPSGGKVPSSETLGTHIDVSV